MTDSNHSKATTKSTAPDLLNFRDLSSAAPGLTPGVLYRAACPVGATPAEIAYLQTNLGIHTMIDLRAPEEVAEFGQAPVLAGATLVTHKRKCVTWLGPLEIQTEEEKLSGEAPGDAPFRIHALSVLNKGRYIRTLLPRMPPQVVVSSLALQLWDAQRGKDQMLEEVNRGGLNMLYEMILLASMLEFGAAMKVVLGALEEKRPLMFYCKAGKDRTGLLAMLVLSVCEVSDKEIIDDYFISDAHGAVALGDLVNTKEVAKLDRELFARAPREVMQHAMTTIRDRFGSIRAYLEACGFSAKDQQRMKELMRAPDQAQ